MTFNANDITLLIIADDLALVNLMRAVLSEQHFDLQVANSAEEGLRLAREIQPDVYIIDMSIPDLDGLQTCQKIRSFSQMPILVLSVYDKPGMVEQVLDAGADDYLLKPVSNNTLVAHLNTLARRTRRTPTNASLATTFSRT